MKNHLKPFYDLPAVGSRPGTYALVFTSDKKVSVTVGRLGKVEICSGYYAYVGSAHGPGGLKSRIGRHMRTSKKLKWHIDYVRYILELKEIWYAYDERVECAWAEKMTSLGGHYPVKGFGSSDCRCHSHFLNFPIAPKFGLFKSLTSENISREIVA